MDGAYYYQENGKLYRIRIERDDTPWNPRTDQDSNIGTMNLYWNRYSLGDNEGKGNADEVLNEIVRDNVPKEKYDEEKLEYEMSRNEKMMLLQYHIVLLPCFIYEHGMLAISCDNSYPFNDRWDAGMAGYIYTTKEKCAEQWGGVDDDWKQRARKELVDEVKLYNQYLQGDCYGYWIDEYNPIDDDWDNTDSCWGFYSDEWGEDLAREIADDSITNEPFIDENDVENIQAELRIMAQAETVVAI